MNYRSYDRRSEFAILRKTRVLHGHLNEKHILSSVTRILIGIWEPAAACYYRYGELPKDEHVLRWRVPWHVKTFQESLES